jgi:hypothetical protein
MKECDSGRASKGSQLHLQNLVNDSPEYLNCLIFSASPSLREYAASDPTWVSPLALEDYAEYRDNEFLRAIGLQELREKLSDFWPRIGPCWDALATVKGKGGGNGVILVEAKSHFGELSGEQYACRAESESSIQKIHGSLNGVKQELGVKLDADWTGEIYQHANRIAHLWFLSAVGDIPTWLVFLHFVGDVEQSGPSTVAEWEVELDGIREKLGLPRQHSLDERIVSVFAPVT